MRIRSYTITAALYFLLLVAIPTNASSVEEKCGPGRIANDTGICSESGSVLIPFSATVPNPSLIPPGQKKADQSRMLNKPAPVPKSMTPFAVYLFWGEGCPHCEQEKQFLAELKKELPLMEVRDFEVWHDKQNADFFSRMLSSQGMRLTGVPVTFVDDRAFTGFSALSKPAIEDAIRKCRDVPCTDPGDKLTISDAGTAQTPLAKEVSGDEDNEIPAPDASVDIPLLGRIDARNASLPITTIVIAGLDSFNPCAFFVLFSLLGLLVHAGSRSRMLLIGGVFVFFSGTVYFLFMAAWLNLFLVMKQVSLITAAAGCLSVVIAAINIKDFVVFKRGVSLSIPDSAKPGLFTRMRRLIRVQSLPSVLLGTTVLALAANSYELLCTAGFPMVFTRILTLQHLTLAAYYWYLVLYNIVYVIPLFIIVLIFSFTLGSKKLTEWQGRVLKLVSGTMMLGLGMVLLVSPALLNNPGISLLLLAGSLTLSLITAAITKKLLL